MLFSKEKGPQIDYLADWPAHYYEIPTGLERRNTLEQIEQQRRSDSADAARKYFCSRRFFSKDNTGNVDAFMHAWMMIKASSAAGVSFLQKKRLTQELKTYMEELCLLSDTPLSKTEEMIRAEEWRDFARAFLASCTDSKAYCSTLFGFVPIKDAVVAEKIAAEITLVTEEYPAKLGLSEEFAPFRKIMQETYKNSLQLP